MYRFFVVFLALALACCSPSLKSEVSNSVVDYHGAESDVSNQMLLSNILMAKAGLPVHFSDLVNIHGSLQLGGQVGTSFPLGDRYPTSNVRGAINPQISASTAPSFDVSSLDSQDFTNGIVSPIDPKAIQYFLDLGVDPHLVLMLFFSGIELGAKEEFEANSPFSGSFVCNLPNVASTASNVAALPAQTIAKDDTEVHARTAQGYKCNEMFSDYVARVRAFTNFHTNTYVEITPVGAPFVFSGSNNLKDINVLDPTKWVLRPVESGMSQLYSVSAPRTAICFGEQGTDNNLQQGSAAAGTPATATDVNQKLGNLISSAKNQKGSVAAPSPAAGKVAIVNQSYSQIVRGDPCEQSEVEVSAGGAATPNVIRLRPRSVLGVVRYLGDILKYQDLNSQGEAGQNCVTLSVGNGDILQPCEVSDVLFRVAGNEAPDDGMSVDFRGTTYYVRSRDSCLSHGTGCDHSIEALAVLNLLLNMNKSASDLRATLSVEALP